MEVIEKTQTAVLSGGLFAIAMPRGSGKTTIHQRAAIWAINYGYCGYVFLVSADAKKANGGLRSIKTEYEFNPLLYADFPEICHPIRELQGAAKSALKQHIDGRPTLINWTAEQAQLPQVEGSLASGAFIGVGGITGAARGVQITLPDNEGRLTNVLRPSLVLVDDFQTRESAASPTQCKTRLDTLTGDLLGMRGPGERFAMLVTSTVIYREDAADQLLDRKKFPEFHGTRKKLVYSWPTDERRWEEYAELRKEAFRRDEEPTEADDFYLANRETMDAGSVVAWPERKLDEEISALQHAYNLRIADPDAFEAEYQNEPVRQAIDDIAFLTADEIADKLSKRPNGELPDTIEHITAAIDVQGNSLWWSVAAWEPGFGGYVLDYGVFPKQGRRFYIQRDLPFTFQTLWPHLNEEQSIRQALEIVAGELASKRWTLDNGAKLGVSRILIDEGYKDFVVHGFCLESGKELCAPAKGIGVTASQRSMSETPKKKGEQLGWNWRRKLAGNNRVIRHTLWDTNAWKTFVQERFATAPGGRGCLSISGDKPMDHRLFANHMTAEFPTRTEGQGRTLLEWKIRPNRPDNHWLDALAMCCVGASMGGVQLIEGVATTKRKTVSLEELKRRTDEKRRSQGVR